MRDWKTTVAAIVGAGASLLGTLGLYTLTAEQQGAIVAVTLLIVGILARDSHPDAK